MNYLMCLNSLAYGGTQTFYVSLARELATREHKVVFASSAGPLQEAVEPLCRHYSLNVFGRETGIAYAISDKFLSKARRATLLNVHPGLRDSFRVERNDLKGAIRRILQSGRTNGELHRWCRGTLGILASLPILGEIIQRESIDCIVCSQGNPTLISYLASRRRSSKSVFLPVVNSFFNSADIFPPLGWKAITRRAKHVVTTSHEISSYLAKFARVPKSKLIVTPNGVDTQKFKPCAGAEQLKFQLGIPTRNQVIVHVSSLVFQKLPMALDLIKAFEQILNILPSTSLVIVGGGNAFDEAKGRADSLNQSLGRPVVIMLGNQDTLLPGVLNMAHIVVGIARCAREAMACGKPVIVSGLTGYAGIVSEENIDKVAATNFSGRQFDVKPNADLLAADTIYLLQNKYRCEELGHFGRRYIEAHDSIHAAANLFEFLSGVK
ncbi:MAG: glycosyltransferase [Phycisphaerae bacterium]